ncbi:MAG: hypothetical protein [Microviridae sp.]|nr:MAG: hypothetical protein [Microviridae sp.]
MPIIILLFLLDSLPLRMYIEFLLVSWRYDMADSVLVSLINSRSKSVKVLLGEVERLDHLASQSRSPVVQASLESVAKVKRQRLARLQAELAAYREEVDRQAPLPLEASKKPR